MDDQLTFDELETTAKPVCRVCDGPAAWQPRNHRWSLYCGSNYCVSRKRRCKVCRGDFVMNQGEAGTKYCSLKCKQQGYVEGFHNNGQGPRIQRRQCTWCSKWIDGGHKPGAKWPYICDRCLEPISHVVSRLKAHNVSHERARKLTIDPGCETCGRDMLEWARPVRKGSKSLEPVLTVDHDHACCPGDRSCGRCVRGLICMRCNAALGMLHDDLAAAQGIADYLRRHAR